MKGNYHLEEVVSLGVMEQKINVGDIFAPEEIIFPQDRMLPRLTRMKKCPAYNIDKEISEFLRVMILIYAIRSQ
jgi:hypothetical protein